MRVGEECSSSTDGGNAGGASASAGRGGSASGRESSLAGGASGVAGRISASTAGSTTTSAGGREAGAGSGGREASAGSGGGEAGAGSGGGQAGNTVGTQCVHLGNVSGVCDTCGDIVQCDGSCPVVACLDQSFNENTDAFFLINERSRWIGQTYTAAKTGHLVGVSVDVVTTNVSYPLRVVVYDTSHGMPSDTLGEVPLSTGGSPLGNIVSFTNRIDQTAGHQYAIGVSYPDAPPEGAYSSEGTWYGCSAGNYAGGEFIISADGVNWSAFPGGAPDLRFSTYVMPN
ncbi:MAG: hypothetical protein ACM3ZE_22130 [Myxococcales bacterium]